ncbi:MAG: Gfo/Idh/MocA family oxidoreductase [Lentisphaeria bacterium]|nr:Gfo/Idh/MocA family oxidoreductase [Lentisphaeria bacterium]
MKRYKIIVAGSGCPHTPLFLRRIRDMRRWEIVAASESDDRLFGVVQKSTSDLPDIKLYRDYKEMFKRHSDVDAVLIGSDNIYHFPMFLAAVEHKFNIFMMKVISMNEDECREMVRIKNSYDRHVACELELHYRPQLAEARRRIVAGEIGEIQSIYLTNVSLNPIDLFPNWGDPLLSYGSRVPIRPNSKFCRGGAITDHPHPYDLIRWITGREFATVSAVSARNQRQDLAVEDHAAIMGKLDNGVPFFVNPSYTNLVEPGEQLRFIWPKVLECNLKVTGTKGYISADFFNHACTTCGKNFDSPDRALVEDVPSAREEIDDSLMGAFAAMLDGRRTTPETGLEESYQAVRVMNAAYDSIYSGKEIVLKQGI